MSHSLNCPEYITPPARRWRSTNGKVCTCGYSASIEYAKSFRDWQETFEDSEVVGRFCKSMIVFEDEQCCVFYSKHRTDLHRTHGFEVAWKKGMKPVWKDYTRPCLLRDYLIPALEIELRT